MTVQNLRCQGGRIVATATPQIQENYSLFFNNSKCHGLMAPSFRRKVLVCFYCNKKSSIKYDGLITQWECGNCESVNYLDENGDITDPPVATEYAAPITRKFAIPRLESQLLQPSSQSSDSSLFCSTCLKNQHLFTASLAQYDFDIDTNNPHYRENERKYFQYRKGLEKRYPQVCEDCEPKVLERMREAGKTAKTDYLRRLMEKSRARRLAAPTNIITLSGSIESAGRLLWYIGLLGQLLWHIMSLTSIARHNYPSMIESSPLVFTILSTFTDYWTSFSASSLARPSLLCSMASVWWNPKFIQMNKGFMNHIKGFSDWYKYQALLLMVRGLVYFLMGTGILADPFAEATTMAHAFALGFLTYLAISAHRSLKVDLTPLWTSTPEKLPNVGPGSRSNSPVNSMADALDQIAATTSGQPRAAYKASPISPPVHEYQRDIRKNSIQTRKPHSPVGLDQLSLNQSSAPSTIHTYSTDLEQMDWSPSTQAQSQYRAFAPNPSVRRDNQLFGQAPIDPKPSPFWYKVPPAPITPAQRLRNPPNQPRLRVTSQEVKENFFNNSTRHPSPPQNYSDSEENTLRTQKQNIEFAQQKFFPPAPPSEAGNNLADLLTSFSLGPPDNETPIKTNEQSSRIRHFVQGVVLLLGLIFWNQTLLKPSEQTTNIMLAIMLACVCIAARTILDNTIFQLASKKQTIFQAIGACLGGIECAAAGFGVLEILAGRGTCENCASLGTILIGGMMVHDIWLASFE